MRRALPATLLVLVLAPALPGCGRSPTDPATRTRQALHEIFLLAPRADAEALAPRIAYTGDDPRRAWHDVCDPSEPAEWTHVQRLAARITVLLGTQPPTFVTWRTATTAQGVLLEWTVRGANGVARFTCVEIGGVITLAEMRAA